MPLETPQHQDQDSTLTVSNQQLTLTQRLKEQMPVTSFQNDPLGQTLMQRNAPFTNQPPQASPFTNQPPLAGGQVPPGGGFSNAPAPASPFQSQPAQASPQPGFARGPWAGSGGGGSGIGTPPVAQTPAPPVSSPFSVPPALPPQMSSPPPTGGGFTNQPPQLGAGIGDGLAHPAPRVGPMAPYTPPQQGGGGWIQQFLSRLNR